MHVIGWGVSNVQGKNYVDWNNPAKNMRKCVQIKIGKVCQTLISPKWHLSQDLDHSQPDNPESIVLL